MPAFACPSMHMHTRTCPQPSPRTHPRALLCWYQVHSTRTYIHGHLHARVCGRTHIFTHSHIHTCSHAYTLTCIHAHMHTCTHAHMHTCSHTHASQWVVLGQHACLWAGCFAQPSLYNQPALAQPFDLVGCSGEQAQYPAPPPTSGFQQLGPCTLSSIPSPTS